MVKLPRQFDGEMIKVDPVNGSKLSDDMVDKMARIIIREAKKAVPSEERLGKMLSELDRMHEFMKNEVGEDDFDCSISGEKVKIVKRSAGAYLKFHGVSRFINNENIYGYIDDLKTKYTSPEYMSVEHHALELLDYELNSSVRHGNVVFIAGLPVSMATVERIQNAIKEACREA